jgi:hypothetical protein
MGIHECTYCEYFTLEHLISITDLKGTDDSYTEKLVNSFVAGISIDEKATPL